MDTQAQPDTSSTPSEQIPPLTEHDLETASRMAQLGLQGPGAPLAAWVVWLVGQVKHLEAALKRAKAKRPTPTDPPGQAPLFVPAPAWGSARKLAEHMLQLHKTVLWNGPGGHTTVPSPDWLALRVVALEVLGLPPDAEEPSPPKKVSTKKTTPKRASFAGGEEFPDAHCVICYCTEDRPCEGGCIWLADAMIAGVPVDLCSACEASSDQAASKKNGKPKAAAAEQEDAPDFDRKVCPVPNCVRRAETKGLCKPHYKKSRRLKMGDEIMPDQLVELSQDGRKARAEKP